ncbi:MAG: hypothetical protein K1X57_02950 [Gemmataceae bacterium]|nr:hypothetical protein [Gemmataceae bacterium]
MKRKNSKKAPAPCDAGTGIAIPVPAFRNPELVRTLSHPDMAPEAWAAYKLGYEPQAMSVWLSVHQPYFLARGHDTQDSIPIFAFELTSALDVLARTVPIPVRYELTQSLAKLNAFNSDATAMMLDDACDGSALQQLLDQGRGLLDSIQIQIGNSIPPESPLRPWYVIGWNLGFWWARNFASDMSPSIAPILTSFARLSETERTNSASLLTIAEMIRISAGKESRQLRRVLSLLGLVRVKTRGPLAVLLSSDMHGVFRILHNRIESELLERQRHLGQLAELKPVWDKNSGRLTYGGRLCKKIRLAKAENVTRILNEFQTQNWPHRVTDPLLEDLKKGKARQSVPHENGGTILIPIQHDHRDLLQRTKTETIRSLNDKLNVLHFAGSYGNEIEWGLKQPG